MSIYKLLNQEVGVGIDLGTTNSVVSIFMDGKATILKSSQNSKTTTPSVVFFGKNGVVVGEEALEKKRQSQNIIMESKRLMGNTYLEVQKFLSNWNFTVVNKDSKLFFV